MIYHKLWFITESNKALDKALPQRDFLQVIDLPTKEQKPYELTYDAEWLAIMKNTNDLFSITCNSIRLPTKGIDQVLYINEIQKAITYRL